MVRPEHEEEDAAGERHVPFAVCPDVEKGEEGRDFGEGEDEEGVLEGGGGDLLHGG